MFSYGDNSGWGNTVNWKKIKLLSKKIRCYPLKSTGNTHNKFIFVLREIHGSKRLWMVDSQEEMTSWIEYIKTAIIGSAGDFTEESTATAATADFNDNNNLGNDVSGTSGNDNNFESDSVSSPAPFQLWHNSESFTQSNTDISISLDILPSHLATEIRRYLSLQATLKNTHNSSEYRDILELYASEPCFTIPISFIKVVLLFCCYWYYYFVIIIIFSFFFYHLASNSWF